jgi:hypothetical protein
MLVIVEERRDSSISAMRAWRAFVYLPVKVVKNKSQPCGCHLLLMGHEFGLVWTRRDRVGSQWWYLHDLKRASGRKESTVDV